MANIQIQMKMKAIAYFQLSFGLLVGGCYINSNNSADIQSQPIGKSYRTAFDSSDYFDVSRNRFIPVAFYFPKDVIDRSKQKIIMFNHGYAGNRSGSNKSYSYLTEYMASKGFFVASIQHELPTDSLLPVSGIIQEKRKSNWERGVQNILFVLNELKRTKPDLDYKHLILMGHSNGGDMTMLFTHHYPELVDKAISLDNRRMPLPRMTQPKIYSLRSSDQLADDGVLPTSEEQRTHGIRIIYLSNTKHNEMDDTANKNQRNEINNYILGFVNE